MKPLEATFKYQFAVRVCLLCTLFACQVDCITRGQNQEHTAAYQQQHQRQLHHRAGSPMDSASQSQVSGALQSLIKIINDMQRTEALERQKIEMSLDKLLRRLEGIERKLDSSVATMYSSEQKIAKMELVLEEKEFSRLQMHHGLADITTKMADLGSNLNNKLDMSFDGLTRRMVNLENSLSQSEQRTLRVLHNRPFRVEPTINLNDITRSMDDIKRTINNQVDNKLSKIEQMLSNNDALVTSFGLEMKWHLNNTLNQISECLGNDDSWNRRDPQIQNGGPRTANRRMRKLEPDLHSFEVHHNSTAQLLAALNSSVTAQGLHIKGIDDDIEVYTRKVLNNVHELIRSVQDNELYINNTLELVNETRRTVQETFVEFIDKEDQVSDLRMVLEALRTELGSKIGELSSSVQNDYVSILASQNAFIQSIEVRIQDTETNINDGLEQLMDEVLTCSKVQQQMAVTSVPSQNNVQIEEKLEKVYGLLAKVVKKLKQERAFEDDTNPVQLSNSRCQLSNESIQSLAVQISELVVNPVTDR
ncbi:hypothetical protein HDE_05776 [Halotydeus destructor]|nr:hypothetical protein HDE_05776 [Halotydeus destructor]